MVRLYHYTSKEGLEKMLTEKLIRDSKEGVYLTSLNPRDYSMFSSAWNIYGRGCFKKMMDGSMDHYIELDIPLGDNNLTTIMKFVADGTGLYRYIGNLQLDSFRSDSTFTTSFSTLWETYQGMVLVMLGLVGKVVLAVLAVLAMLFGLVVLLVVSLTPLVLLPVIPLGLGIRVYDYCTSNNIEEKTLWDLMVGFWVFLRRVMMMPGPLVLFCQFKVWLYLYDLALGVGRADDDKDKQK